MSRRRSVVGLLALVLCTGGLLLGQDKKEPVKYKGTLPAGWKKLGLTEDQVQKIYKVQNDFRAKIEPLELQIDNLKKQRQIEMEKVLTKANKDRLKELRDSDPLKDEKKTEEKKP